MGLLPLGPAVLLLYYNFQSNSKKIINSQYSIPSISSSLIFICRYVELYICLLACQLLFLSFFDLCLDVLNEYAPHGLAGFHGLLFKKLPA